MRDASSKSSSPTSILENNNTKHNIVEMGTSTKKNSTANKNSINTNMMKNHTTTTATTATTTTTTTTTSPRFRGGGNSGINTQRGVTINSQHDTTTTITTTTTNNNNNKIKSKANTNTNSISNNNNNNNNNHNNNTPKSQMNDTSILAPSYVPAHLRQIFFLPAGTSFPTTKPTSMLHLAQHMFCSLVAPVPTCTCGNQHQHVYPWLMVPNLSRMEPGFVYSPVAQQRASPGFVKTFPSIYQVSGRDAYIQFFERLIREEYEETMMLYERYTQYNQQVSPIISAQKEPPQQQNSQQNRQQTSVPSSSQSNPPQTPLRAVISIPGIADARPTLQTGDNVLLRCPTPDGLYAMELQTDVIRTLRNNGTSRPKDQVVISWHENHTTQARMYSGKPNTLFAVRFLPSVTTSERCLTALKWLSTIHPLIAKNLLFPSEPPILPGDEEDDTNNNDPTLLLLLSVPDATNSTHLLNEQQAKFCRMVLRRTNHPSMENVRPPMILTGPAGTGKTKALLMSILNTLNLNKTNRVLVCAPSHTASDVIARRLQQHLPASEIFRLCDATRPVETAPSDILPLMRQNVLGEFTLPSTAAELLSFRVIVCTCLDAHILYLCGMTNVSLRSRRHCLQSFIQQSIASSPGMTISENAIQGADTPHFTHLFIDEAAQATEPETLIPFSVVVDDAPNIQKVEIALTGDPRQLHPEINSPWAREGLQLSLLERLLQQGSQGRDHMLGPPTKDSWVTMEELIEYSLQTASNSSKEEKDKDHYLSVFLTLSYRGHPSFLLTPSKLFYFDKLRSVHTAAEFDDKWCNILRGIEALSTCSINPVDKAMDWPIHFRGVIGKDTSFAVEAFWGSNSWANPQEAQAIVEIVRYMVFQAQVPTQVIGIMAAFRAQVVLIRRLLREQNLGAVNVGMVEDYQAVERHVILLSLTRSNPRFIPMDVQRNAGLYQQPKRMNVALTRAEHLLIVVGNPNTMEQDPYWKEWLQFCHRNGLWYRQEKGGDGGGEENGNGLHPFISEHANDVMNGT